MIAKIFSKSNPMIFLICIIIILLAFIPVSIKGYQSGLGIIENITHFSVFFLLIFTIFLTDFIAKKNTLNKNDSYAIVLFKTALLLIPESFLDLSVALSNIFVLLAFRKLLSLQSLTGVKQKIFDASIWVSVACVFEFWSILFFMLIFISILMHVSNDFRNWLIPFIGFFTIATIILLYSFIIDFKIIEFIKNKAVFNFNFGYTNEIFYSLSLGILVFLLFLFLIFQTLYLGNYLATLQNSMKKVLILMIIGFMVYLFSADKNNGLLLYCIAPLSIVGSNFINKQNREWIKDFFLYILIISSIISFYLYL